MRRFFFTKNVGLYISVVLYYKRVEPLLLSVCPAFFKDPTSLGKTT